MKVILDTNFLIDCLRFGVDLKSELAGNEMFVLDTSLLEIEKIAKRKTKESPLARLALEYIKRSGLIIMDAKEENVDDSLVSFSKEGYAIATHDKVLKNRLKRIDAKVIYIRQKKYLVIE
jgi:rRNA-processing protein FCF1